VDQAARAVAQQEGKEEDEEVVGVPEGLKVLHLQRTKEEEK